MSELMKTGTEPTITTIELRNIVNEARQSMGENPVQNSDFLCRVQDELEGELGLQEKSVNPIGGRPSLFYTITHDQAMLVGMRESKAVRRKVLDKLKQLEGQKKVQTQALHLPDFGNPAEAARAWANQYEQRLLAEHQRDDAIRTKAEIGSRREATAMATASAATRKANALEIQLDESAEYATIKKMQILYGGTYSWRPLKECSEAAGLSVQKVFDANYGEVNAYHREAWIAVYNVEP